MASGLLESIDRSTHLAGHNRLALLLFRLDPRQYFGINVFKVQEVLERPRVSWVPSAHPLVRGIADIRGRVMPIIDLRLAVGGQPLEDDSASHVIVTEFNRSVQGFLVHAVERIIHVEVETVQPPPPGDGDSYLTAVTRYGNELIEIIDVERVLATVVGEGKSVTEGVLKQAQELQSGGLRALVVDDSKVARSQIERILTQVGVECVLMRDGREALQYLQGIAAQGRSPSDELLMVISDVEMPDMDGYTLTTEIRRDPALRDLYVMLHTSLSGVFNNAMVQKVGADRFIAKFNADELAQGVLDLVRERQAAA
ncbi:MAG TPA: chemotaxis protein CheV [Stenotrophobium sp.]|nr:chemotaxis protein CheV [Stenotrophobium sp.]